MEYPWTSKEPEEVNQRITYKRSGLTIIEVVVAMVILVTVMIPLSDTFTTFRTGFVKISQKTLALNLASSVLEHIHQKLYDDDLRLFDLLDSDAEKNAAATEDAAMSMFDQYIELNTSITSEADTSISSYFISIHDLTQSGDFGITLENDPDLYKQLREYRCSVNLYYSAEDDIIDSDVDGASEKDMAEVRVRIHWLDDGHERFVELWTVYSARQYIDFR